MGGSSLNHSISRNDAWSYFSFNELIHYLTPFISLNLSIQFLENLGKLTIQ